jgi:hypothetical protein
MTGTDEARRLLQEALKWLPKPSKYVATSQLHNVWQDIEAWLSANPEGKPDAGVTEATTEMVEVALHAINVEDRNFHVSWKAMQAAINAALSRLPSAVPAAPETIPGQWRHKKRGTDHTILFAVTLQTDTPLTDGHPLLIYESENGRRWARSPLEFYDGRFERVDAAPPAVSQPPADTRETGNG